MYVGLFVRSFIWRILPNCMNCASYCETVAVLVYSSNSERTCLAPPYQHMQIDVNIKWSNRLNKQTFFEHLILIERVIPEKIEAFDWNWSSNIFYNVLFLKIRRQKKIGRKIASKCDLYARHFHFLKFWVFPLRLGVSTWAPLLKAKTSKCRVFMYVLRQQVQQFNFKV